VKMSEGAVRTRASRALARLRTELSDDSSDSRTASS
jgi:DNA-directed RNA polymerase specialized sigma24 family protein